MVAHRPDLFYAFVAMGTAANGPRGEEISYDYVHECLSRRGDADGLRIEIPGLDTMRLLTPPDPWIFELQGGPGDGEKLFLPASPDGTLRAHAAIYHLQEAPRWTDPRWLGAAALFAVLAVAGGRFVRHSRRSNVT